MKTYEQLMTHYWGKIVPMAEAAGINPWECVRYDGRPTYERHPDWHGSYSRYTFALTVLEGRPVFVGSILYANNCAAPLTIKGHSTISGNLFIGECMNYDIRILSWRPTTKKRTFMLNDNELNCPINDTNGCRLDFLGVDYYFNSVQDRNEVAIAINNMLHTARDKE